MATRQYIGARYVPQLFSNPDGSNNWIQDIPYESLTIVTYLSNSYTSKLPVPASNIPPNEDKEHWVLTGNYNAQIEEYRQDVVRLEQEFDFVTPESYGAKGDGVTDDTQAIQDAFNSGKNVLFGKAKIYVISNSITVNSNTIIDFNYSTLKLVRETPCNIVVCEDVKNITLKNGYIIGVLKSGYESNDFCILVSACENVNIINMDITNNISDGIYVGYRYYYQGEGIIKTNHINIIDCNIHEVGRNGISVVSGDDVLIDNCKFKNITDNFPKAGIDIEPETGVSKVLHLNNLVISNCTFVNENETAYAIGINDGNLVEGSATIRNCKCDRSLIYYSNFYLNEDKGINVTISNVEFLTLDGSYAISIQNPNISFPVTIKNVILHGTTSDNTDFRTGGGIVIRKDKNFNSIGGITIDGVTSVKENTGHEFPSLINAIGMANVDKIKNVYVSNISKSDVTKGRNCLFDVDMNNSYINIDDIFEFNQYYQQDANGVKNGIIPINVSYEYQIVVDELYDGEHKFIQLNNTAGAIGFKINDLNKVKFAADQSKHECYVGASKNNLLYVKNGLIYLLECDVNPIYR